MKTEEEYVEILTELMQANSTVEPDWLDDNLRAVLLGVIAQFNSTGVTELISTGNIEDMLKIPFATPMVMFALGVHYGRREAAELLRGDIA